MVLQIYSIINPNKRFLSLDQNMLPTLRFSFSTRDQNPFFYFKDLIHVFTSKDILLPSLVQQSSRYLWCIYCSCMMTFSPNPIGHKRHIFFANPTYCCEYLLMLWHKLYSLERKNPFLRHLLL